VKIQRFVFDIIPRWTMGESKAGQQQGAEGAEKK